MVRLYFGGRIGIGGMFGEPKTFGPRKAPIENLSKGPSGDGQRQAERFLDVYRQRTFVLAMVVTVFLSLGGAFALDRAPKTPAQGAPSLTPVPVEVRVAIPSKTPFANFTVTPQQEAVVAPRITTVPSPTEVRVATPTATKKPTSGPILVSTPAPQAIATGVSGPSGRIQPQGTPTPVATRIVGSRYVPPTPPYNPPPFRLDISLESQIRKSLGENVANYGVVVKRLSDGGGVTINADREFYAASLFKVLVMFEVFKQRESKLLGFDESLTFTPPYVEYALGDWRWPLWSQVSVRELQEAMITESDNVAAIMLHDRVGGYNIIADYKSIGLKHTDITTDTMPTSAGDMAMWLEMIARGKAVNEKSSQGMIDLLARQKINDRLPALLPTGIKVAHKTGNWDNATHDVGVVYAPRGAYVIAVLSDKAGQTKGVAELSRLVYEYFEGRI